MSYVKHFSLALLAGAALGASQPATAGFATLTLSRASLDNVNDAAGVTQHEGGKILNAGGTTVGTYITIRRATFSGTSAYNTAAMTTTLFFAPVGAAAPANVTLQGAHIFSSGAFQGSVSAASPRYSYLRGADASATIPTSGSTKLTITWVGTPPVTLP